MAQGAPGRLAEAEPLGVAGPRARLPSLAVERPGLPGLDQPDELVVDDAWFGIVVDVLEVDVVDVVELDVPVMMGGTVVDDVAMTIED